VVHVSRLKLRILRRGLRQRSIGERSSGSNFCPLFFVLIIPPPKGEIINIVPAIAVNRFADDCQGFDFGRKCPKEVATPQIPQLEKNYGGKMAWRN
jgi:hypothetical protein